MGQLAGDATSPQPKGQEGDKGQPGYQPAHCTPVAAPQRGPSTCLYSGAQVPHHSPSSPAGAPGEMGWLHEGAGIGQVGQEGELQVWGYDTNIISKALGTQ